MLDFSGNIYEILMSPLLAIKWHHHINCNFKNKYHIKQEMSLKKTNGVGIKKGKK